MYAISAFVGKRKILEQQFKDVGSNYIVDLHYAPYALIPITGEFEEAIQQQCQIDLKNFSFKDYPAHLEKIIGHFVKSPQEITVAYVGAEFFGSDGVGVGYVFDKGLTKIFNQENDVWPNSNISMALKAIGVPENLSEKLDAFDMAGLGRSRSTSKWLSS